MELKKLGFMNIKRANSLDRKQMRNILAGSLGSAGVRCTPTSEVVCITDCDRNTVELECGNADQATCYPDYCI